MQSVNRNAVAITTALALLCATTQAEVVIETVTVGNPGNDGELSGAGAGGNGPDRICGAVDYVYDIAKYEVTAAQYTEFLNAVATETDTYGLYDMTMWGNIYGCKIQRSGSPGSYTYSVAPDWADRPVNLVSWGDAARFCNWLHNGQPTGSQDLSTTEDGSYFLNGAMSNAELLAVVREPDATRVIPTEDEWYKAAYHKNDGVTGNYWDYATSTDAVPSNDLIDPDPGNNATFYDNDYTIGNPYYRTEVGAHENSDSPYGTFDQSGNTAEWNETVSGTYRGFRGGSWMDNTAARLHAAYRRRTYPLNVGIDIGFRVAFILGPCRNAGDSGNHCSADLYPNNGDGIWEYGVDGDCAVNFHDLGELLPNYGITSGAAREDGDVYPPNAGDGAVDLSDLGELLAQYGDDCN